MDFLTGKKKSKASQSITNNTVNENFMKTLNKDIMNVAVETIINNASACSSAVDVNNSCDLSKMVLKKGDLNVNSNQTAQAKVNFNCIQANKTSSDMSTNMISKMISEMEALNGTEAASNLNSAAQLSNKSGFLSMPSSTNTSTSANQINNVTNKTKNIVQNIFERNLNNNFSVNTVNECINKTNISNLVSTSGTLLEEGNVNIECIQTASVDQVQNCKQLSDAISKTTQETFQELGLSVATESDTAISTESTVTTESKNVATGPIEEAGNAISSIVGAVGLAYLGPVIGFVVISCVCIILIGILGYFSYQFMTSENAGKAIDIMGSKTNGTLPKVPGMRGGVSDFFSSES